MDPRWIPGSLPRRLEMGRMPQTLNLTARTVRSIKPLDRRRDYYDAAVAGLVLRVTPTGAKTWCVIYRHRGQRRRLTLGSATVLGLADARERARAHLCDVSKGLDPAAHKRAERDAMTVGDLATLYLEKWAKPRKRSWRYDANLLRRKVLPAWKHRAVKDVTRADVRELVERIADAGAPIGANRVVALLSKMFTFALDRELIATHPALRIPKPGREQARDRVLSEDEIRVAWEAFGRLEDPMAAFYKLRLLTAQRGGEVAAMRWQDVDLVTKWWTIPAPVAKNRLSHRVPLADAAVDILTELRRAAPPDAEYVMQGARGKRQQRLAAHSFRGLLSDFHGHDLRRTAASLMTAGGVSRLVVSKLLNHVERGVTAIYDRHSYDSEKREALDWWARRLTLIVRGDPTGTVLRFVRSA